MTTHRDLNLDVATGISQGRREHQEDAIVSDFPIGGEIGLAVLADGMGGHAAGDIASKIAVTEVFSELKIRASDPEIFVRNAPLFLRSAADGANACIAGHIRAHTETRGMGTTLIALAVAGDRLFWLSVGDSPLFLFRDGQLAQINEDHSLAPQIDNMARMGLLSPEEARHHPDRNCLTSAITGTPLGQVDCPVTPLDLAPGDILIAASDGLTSIEIARIGTILSKTRKRASAEIARVLFEELEAIADPDQDNVCFSVIRVVQGSAQAGRHAGIHPFGQRALRFWRGGAATARPRQAGGSWAASLIARLFIGLRRPAP